MPRNTPSRPSPASIIRHILAVAIFLIAAGCSGGGCGGGCSSCGGITPLTNGFDPMNRIENAGSARVTPSGLVFLQKNLGALAKGLLGVGLPAVVLLIYAAACVFPWDAQGAGAHWRWLTSRVATGVRPGGISSITDTSRSA